MKELVIKNVVFGQGKPVICVPVVKKTTDTIIEEVKSLVEQKVQMIEWRVDWFEHAMDLTAVQTVLTVLKPIVRDCVFLMTFRTKKQGGELSADSSYLEKLFFMAAKTGAIDMVDVEFFEQKHPGQLIRELKEKNVAVISSHHDFDETPDGKLMNTILEEMAEGGADIVKLAVMPRRVSDVVALLSATAEFHENNTKQLLVTMSMGALGVVSRISGETFGSCITFGSHEQASAPGQLQMKQLDGILEGLHQAIRA